MISFFEVREEWGDDHETSQGSGLSLNGFQLL